MMNMRIYAVFCAGMIMLSSCVMQAHKPTGVEIRPDKLNDLPTGSCVGDFYNNHPYMCFVGLAVAAGFIVFALSETFRSHIAQALNIKVTKSCACGCSVECGCRTGSESGCSMTPNKNSSNCACCAVRSVMVQ